MYTGLLHTHRLVVILFLVIYLVKTILLLSGKSTRLAAFTKRIKIPEIVISTLFLLTGLVMFINKWPALEGKNLLYLSIKLVAVFSAIPLAVIGFKRSKKALAVLSMVLIVGAYGLAEMGKRAVEAKPLAVLTDATAEGYDLGLHGKAIYEAQCIACHQADGKGGVAGAKNLTTSQLTDEEIAHIVLNGKNAMAGYKKVLTEQDLTAVVSYVKTFRP
ncbi:MAG: c-type cytochrome [Bernardetiaceae bacterium]